MPHTVLSSTWSAAVSLDAEAEYRDAHGNAEHGIVNEECPVYISSMPSR
jgi:hypothetical protein